mgnify:CR=1 FL=1
MTFAAIIPADKMVAANNTLADLGFGPSSFSVPMQAGTRSLPEYAALHLWNAGDEFATAVKNIADVQWSSITGTPDDVVRAVLNQVGAQRESDAKPLTGQVTPGLHHDEEGDLWMVIQPYDTSVYTDPAAIPALIRRARTPGIAESWVQPLDQFDAYGIDPWTEHGETVTHNGKTWLNTHGEGNIWEPDVFGWVEVINLNTADAAALQTLDGVGPSLAQDIIAARPFASLLDLADRVSGIGLATVDGWGAAAAV